MKTFPMFLKMENRRVVIVGGGEQAAQKCRLMLKTEAQITILADQLDPELEGYALENRVCVDHPNATPSAFLDTALVFVATGCKGADAAWCTLAKSQGALVNVVDAPDLCDAYTPSIVDRDPVVIAIGTEGTAPVLGRQIKSQIEKQLEPNLGQFARLCGNLRTAVAQNIAPTERRRFWRWVFGSTPRKTFASGSERDAIAMIKAAITPDPSAQPRSMGQIHTITADASEPDLISLRDAQKLQEADMIYYDHPDLLSVIEYARRDAERHYVGSSQTGVEQRLARTAAENGAEVVVIRHKPSKDNVTYLAALA